jgi:transcriptional regulator with XRE-family HTH domain
VSTDVSLHIGSRLTARRQRLRLSLADVAQQCGVTLQQIHRYETGANTISAPMLWALSQCLDVEVAYFFDGLATENS